MFYYIKQNTNKMKKIILIGQFIPFIIFGQFNEKDTLKAKIHFCSTDEYMKVLYEKYPAMKKKQKQLDSVLVEIKEGRIKIANYADTSAMKGDTTKKAKNKGGRISTAEEVIPWVVRIPVVVHVVYRFPSQNISDAQIKSQITALNQHFRRLNSNAANTPAAFAGVARDARIEFCLATIDPNGNPTTGITRTETLVQQFTGNPYSSNIDKVKFTNQGGRDIWNRDNYLNIWVCELDDSFGQGYAQLPSGYSPSTIYPSGPTTDGVVVDYKYFGTTGTANVANFSMGTIAVHEVGHWLGLYHIFGNGTRNDCADDAVSDTPLQIVTTFTGGCATFPKVSCNNGTNGGMFMNYMDYSEGDCMNMFTAGQRDRMMNAIYVSRSTFSTYNNISIDGNPIPTDNYGSTKSLTSTGKVNSGSTVNFRSGDMIRLKPGFRATQGSNFRAKPNECVCSGTLSNVGQHIPYRIALDTTKQNTSNSTTKQKLLSIYPNPTSNKLTTVEYNVGNKGVVRIYIMNSLGMHIKDLVYEYNHAMGKYSVEANLSDLASGMYYVAFKDLDGYEVKKLIIE